MLVWFAATAMAGDLLIQHARLWDGTGTPAQEDVDIRVSGDRVVAIGHGLPADGADVLDATGATVLPGLIDAHVHLSMDPGAAYRTETADEHRQHLRQHLKAYLACGFTTILDPAVLPDQLAAIRSVIDEGAPSPRYLTLGTPFSPAGGYVAVVLPEFPSVATPDDVARQLDQMAALDVVGIKTTVEPGFLKPIWPIYSDDVAAAIRDGAAQRGLRVYTHATSARSQAWALEHLGTYAFVHPPFKADADWTAAAAKAGVYEETTLAIADSSRVAWEPERLTDPLVTLTVPPAEIATAADPEVEREFSLTLVRTMLPGLPMKRFIARMADRESTVGRRVRQQEASVLALARAGVPIVLGSDAGNWPAIPSEFHGPTSVRELELLGEAGLSPVEALTAATRTPAKMIGVDAGTVEVGHIADLVLVDGDPLTDLSAVRHVRVTVRAGVAHTPTEWMSL